MRETKLILIAIFFSNYVFSQIEKGCWLFGGTAEFHNDKINYRSNDTYQEKLFQINGNAGYFFMNKFAGGLRPSMGFATTSIGSISNKSHSYDIGPFVRYYLLPADKKYNLFVDAEYAFGTIGVSQQPNTPISSFSISGGPVIFLNSAVALELSVAYTQKKYYPSGDNYKENIISTRLGLQFHLQKE